MGQQQPQRRSHVDTLKVDVDKFKGVAGESLLRWFVELEAAMIARGIEQHSMRVTFAMSNLAGRAKTWAFGRRMGDPNCFASYEDLKRELRETFEPPKTEFRARSEFLGIKQGKRDIHAYSQHARLLTSCIVSEPIDNSTQVVTFMRGLSDGPIKTHLFRMYPRTLEEAISLAIQEDFNMQQAYVHSSGYKPKVHHGHQSSDGTEPMACLTRTTGRLVVVMKTTTMKQKQMTITKSSFSKRPSFQIEKNTSKEARLTEKKFITTHLCILTLTMYLNLQMQKTLS